MAATTPPLSLGEILDRTVQIYRRNFLLLVGISILPAAFDVLVSGSVGIFFTSRAAIFQTPAGGQALLGFVLVLLAFFLIGIPLLVAVFSAALSALNYAAFLRHRGEAVTIRAAYAYSLRHFWRYLGIMAFQMLFAAIIPSAAFAGIVFVGAMVVALAATGAGKPLAALFGVLAVFLVLVVIAVAIWIWLRFCLAFPACVTENQKPWACMQRSSRLSKGSRGRIFVMYVLVFVLTLVAYYAFTIPVDILLKLTVYKAMAGFALFTKPPVLLQVFNLFVSFLERALVMPIYAVALLLFYNDQRTRQEGYDIELLMAQAGWTLPQPVPHPAEPATEAIFPPHFSANSPASSFAPSPEAAQEPAPDPASGLAPYPASGPVSAPAPAASLPTPLPEHPKVTGA